MQIGYWTRYANQASVSRVDQPLAAAIHGQSDDLSVRLCLGRVSGCYRIEPRAPSVFESVIYDPGRSVETEDTARDKKIYPV